MLVLESIYNYGGRGYGRVGPEHKLSVTLVRVWNGKDLPD